MYHASSAVAVTPTSLSRVSRGMRVFQFNNSKHETAEVGKKGKSKNDRDDIVAALEAMQPASHSLFNSARKGGGGAPSTVPDGTNPILRPVKLLLLLSPQLSAGLWNSSKYYSLDWN